MKQYIKTDGYEGSFCLWLFGEDGEPIRRVNLGQDLIDLLKSGAKYINLNGEIDEPLDPNLVDFEIEEIKMYLKEK